MFRHAIFRRRAGLVLLPSFRGIVSITGWGGTARMSYWVRAPPRLRAPPPGAWVQAASKWRTDRTPVLWEK